MNVRICLHLSGALGLKLIAQNGDSSENNDSSQNEQTFVNRNYFFDYDVILEVQEITHAPEEMVTV